MRQFITWILLIASLAGVAFILWDFKVNDNQIGDVSNYIPSSTVSLFRVPVSTENDVGVTCAFISSMYESADSHLSSALSNLAISASALDSLGYRNELGELNVIQTIDSLGNVGWGIMVGVTGRLNEENLSPVLESLIGGSWNLDAQSKVFISSEGHFAAIQNRILSIFDGKISKGGSDGTMPSDYLSFWSAYESMGKGTAGMIQKNGNGEWTSVEFVVDGNQVFLHGTRSGTTSAQDEVIAGFQALRILPSNLDSLSASLFYPDMNLGSKMVSLGSSGTGESTAFLTELESACQCDAQDLFLNKTSAVWNGYNGQSGISLVVTNHFKIDLPGQEHSTYKEWEINRINACEWLGHLGILDCSDAFYMTAVDDHIMLGDSEESLVNWIDDLLAGRTLEQTPETRVLCKQMMPYSGQVKLHFEEGNNQLPGTISQLNNSKPAGTLALWQEYSSPENTRMIFGIYQVSGAARTSSESGWHFALDSKLSSAPKLVRNHYTQHLEILVQDEENQLYHVDENGELLWSRSLEEKIISEIHPVDLFRNGKLQFVFCSESKLFCIDRLGKDVEGFPTNLPSSVSQLYVFDYDDKKDYRFLLTSNGGAIYNYNGSGKKINGWKYKSTNSEVIGLEHFKIRDKDYILCVDKSGEARYLRRDGRKRINKDIKLSNLQGDSWGLIKANSLDECSVLYLDTAGRVGISSIAGVSEDISVMPQADYLKVADVRGNSSPEIIVVDSNEVSLYDNEWSRLFSLKAESELHPFIKVFRFSSDDIRIGVVSKGGQGYLLNASGRTTGGSPFKSDVPFTIGDLNKDGYFEVITGESYGELNCTPLSPN